DDRLLREDVRVVRNPQADSDPVVRMSVEAVRWHEEKTRPAIGRPRRSRFDFSNVTLPVRSAFRGRLAAALALAGVLALAAIVAGLAAALALAGVLALAVVLPCVLRVVLQRVAAAGRVERVRARGH